MNSQFIRTVFNISPLSLLRAVYIIAFIFVVFYFPLEIQDISIIDKIALYISPFLLLFITQPKSLKTFLAQNFLQLILFSLFCLTSIIPFILNPTLRGFGFLISYFSQLLWFTFFLSIKETKEEKIIIRLLIIIFYIICAGAFLELIYPKLFILRPNIRFSNLEFSSFFSNPNHFSNIQVFSFILSAIAYERRLISSNLHLFNFFLSMGTIVLSQSRAGLLFMFFFLFFYALIKVKNNKRIIQILKKIFFPFILFVSTIPFLSSLISYNKRFYIWDACLGALKNSPLFGIGSGTFGPNANLYSSKMLNIPMSPHSMYWGIIAENGLFGFLLFMLTVATVLSTNKSKDSKEAITSLGLITFLLSQVFEYHLVYYQGLSNLIFWLLMSMTVVHVKKKQQSI